MLVGGGVGVGLLLTWAAWPRRYPNTVAAADGESVFNGHIKIGNDGRVTVIVPQIEMGQGAYTLLAQIAADELGADWRTIAVAPAAINPQYANHLVASEWDDGTATFLLGDAARWVQKRTNTADALMITGGSSTIRAFEPALREAGAAARTLLCMAAAVRWDADWRACDAVDGFVVRGNDQVRFGEIAAEAAQFELPSEIPFRIGTENRLRGKSVPRLDLPTKVDGSANYVADIRLPEMVYASIRMGPLGDARLARFDEKAVAASRDVIGTVVHDHWVAAVGQTWFAADKALVASPPHFTIFGDAPGDDRIKTAFTQAFNAEGTEWLNVGDVAEVFATSRPVGATYTVGFAPHVALEPMSATAVIRDGILELWLPTQVPGLARMAAANAIGFALEKVVVHPVIIGGSFGRKYETEIAAQVAFITQKIGKPVQLTWSREQDMAQDRFRPAVTARMFARVDGAQVSAWRARIAAPAPMTEMNARIRTLARPADAQMAARGVFEKSALSGADTPYAIPNMHIVHHPVDIGVATGKWRSGADSYTAFFNESFIDELASKSGVDPFSFRMGMLGGNKRLANCLSRATVLGGWQGGGQGSQQGIACHSMLGSHIAVLAEAMIDEFQRVRVTKLVAVADLGRVSHTDIARQQIEGGLLFGMAAAVSNAVKVDGGVVHPRSIGGLALPRLRDTPQIIVEIIPSTEAFGGVGEVAVPPVAPAIANALYAGGGRRFRSLPLMPRNI
jgi:isoquinoline 1-oxidoreductase subunit beta